VNRQILRLGVGLVVCYVALFGMVNYVQVLRADELNDDPRNTRAIVRDFDRNRGQIITADGVVIAETVPAAPESRFEHQRVYPQGELYGHITGFFNFSFGADGVERFYNNQLAGETSDLEYQSFSDLFVDRERVGDVTLTIRHDIQQVARDALLGTGAPRGSVVALDPRSGAILAMYSTPSYDPNLLSTHDQAAAQAARDFLDPSSRNSPLVPAMYRKSFFPGSTFKVVTSSVGVDRAGVTGDQPVYPPASEFDIDFTDNELENFGGSTCGGPLFTILPQSCNTAFADMGVNTSGETNMVAGAEAYGFNSRPPLDLPAVAASPFPTEFPDDQGNGPLARASIGQGDVQATPLQMALVAAGAANDGRVMVPHVLDRVTDDRQEVVEEFEEAVWTEAMSASSAAVVREAMIRVVTDGSGGRAAIPGFVVGGKTGTAQLGTEVPSSHAWFISWAGRPGATPEVAVAVLIEAQPGVSEVTGGRLAAPVAQVVMSAVLGAA
jgi:peptidoglycan glycosyltransferase